MNEKVEKYLCTRQILQQKMEESGDLSSMAVLLLNALSNAEKIEIERLSLLREISLLKMENAQLKMAANHPLTSEQRAASEAWNQKGAVLPQPGDAV